MVLMHRVRMRGGTGARVRRVMRTRQRGMRFNDMDRAFSASRTWGWQCL
ncbi:MAG: hypothetical protein ACREMQ_04325 [Longimicrobiales bacterium]